MEKLNHFSAQHLCDFTYFLFLKENLYLETQYFTAWEVCKRLSSVQWLLFLSQSCSFFIIKLWYLLCVHEQNLLWSEPFCCAPCPTTGVLQGALQRPEFSMACIRDEGQQRLEWLWTPCGLQVGVGLCRRMGSCLALVPCISVVPGVKLCSEGPGLFAINLFIYKAAYFRPGSTNTEWHCTHVLINTLHSCNASLGMVFKCNQMRHMSERWQWNPMMSYICF